MRKTAEAGALGAHDLCGFLSVLRCLLPVQLAPNLARQGIPPEEEHANKNVERGQHGNADPPDSGQQQIACKAGDEGGHGQGQQQRQEIAPPLQPGVGCGIGDDAVGQPRGQQKDGGVIGAVPLDG